MKRCVPGICFEAAHFAPASKTVPSKPTIPPRSNATPCEVSFINSSSAEDEETSKWANPKQQKNIENHSITGAVD